MDPCSCAPVFDRIEKRLDKDKHDLIKHIDQSQLKLDSRLAYLERKTKDQIFGLNQARQISNLHTSFLPDITLNMLFSSR